MWLWGSSPNAPNTHTQRNTRLRSAHTAHTLTQIYTHTQTTTTTHRHTYTHSDPLFGTLPPPISQWASCALAGIVSMLLEPSLSEALGRKWLLFSVSCRLGSV